MFIKLQFSDSVKPEPAKKVEPVIEKKETHKAKKKLKEKLCATCGFSFEPRTKNQKYCRTACRKSKRK